MIDFSKLSRPTTAAERQRDDEQRIARQIEEDLKRRREWSRKSVTVILALEAEFRHTLSGDQCLHLRGAQADGKTIAATWYAPEHFTRRQVDAIFDPADRRRQSDARRILERRHLQRQEALHFRRPIHPLARRSPRAMTHRRKTEADRPRIALRNTRHASQRSQNAGRSTPLRPPKTARVRWDQYEHRNRHKNAK